MGHCWVQMLCWSGVSSVLCSPKRRPLLLSSVLSPCEVLASPGAHGEVQKQEPPCTPFGECQAGVCSG